MDPLTITALTTQAIAILTPFVGKMQEAIANKAGEAVFERGKHMYEVVQARFAKEADGGKTSKVLENFASDPKEYQINLRNNLLTLLETDPNFANMLSQIVHSGSGPIQQIEIGDYSVVEGNQMKNSIQRGAQTIHGGDGTAIKENIFEIN